MTKQKCQLLPYSIMMEFHIFSLINFLLTADIFLLKNKSHRIYPYFSSAEWTFLCNEAIMSLYTELKVPT